MADFRDKREDRDAVVHVTSVPKHLWSVHEDGADPVVAIALRESGAIDPIVVNDQRHLTFGVPSAVLVNDAFIVPEAKELLWDPQRLDAEGLRALVGGHGYTSPCADGLASFLDL